MTLTTFALRTTVGQLVDQAAFPQPGFAIAWAAQPRPGIAAGQDLELAGGGRRWRVTCGTVRDL